MNGYLARSTGCCGTTSVDLGLYSSMEMLCAEASQAPRKTTITIGFIGVILKVYKP
jgi:hypothetical protein